jgi:hypothetical protein
MSQIKKRHLGVEAQIPFSEKVNYRRTTPDFFNDKPFVQFFDPFHLNGIVLGDVRTDVDANLTSFAPVYGYISRLVGFAIINTVRFRTILCAEVAILSRANVLINSSDVVHIFSSL